MSLTDEQKKHCIDAGKFDINTKNLAFLIELPEQEVKEALSDTTSEIYKYHSKGKALFMVEPFKALEREANKGSAKAATALLELKKELRVQQMINDYLGE